MSLRIGGMGWVTPLGNGVNEVWQRLQAGEESAPESIEGPQAGKSFQIFRVPASATKTAPSHPRLRRSSAISRFAAVAGLDAMKDAGVSLDTDSAQRTAVIFAISNGGVIYTKRFYHDIVATGAQTASPLLFPETVFNAPASHLAAILGITGASYTLVGDGAVGLLALKMAEDLMLDPAFDRCLVVGAEEADGLLCDAYDRWRLLRNNPPIECFRPHPRGTILSEGAGALLLNRGGSVEIERIDAGGNFAHQADAPKCMEEIFARLAVNERDLIIASANGTFVDRAEAAAIARHCEGAQVYTPKVVLGESVGASSLWQIICGAKCLTTRQVPRVENSSFDRVLVSVCGMNQQTAGATLSISGPAPSESPY